MLILSLIILILSNSITLRRDKSIVYPRATITILVIAALISYDNLNFLFLNKGIGIFGGLFHATSITSVFQIFIMLISATILLLTSVYPRKVWLREYSSMDKTLFTKLVYPRKVWLRKYSSMDKTLFTKLVYGQTVILNKMGEQYKIIEYSLIILFIVTGGILLVSTNDVVSIFLAIGLQSYGLYLLSTIYRDSEPATSGGLMYFLLKAFSWNSTSYKKLINLAIVSAVIYISIPFTKLDSYYICLLLIANLLWLVSLPDIFILLGHKCAKHEYKRHSLLILYVLTLSIVFYMLLEGTVTTDFNNDYPNLSYIHLFLCCTAISMVIIHIVCGKKKTFSEVKEQVFNIWKGFKGNPWESVKKLSGIFALLIIFSWLISAVLGVTICTVSWGLLYVTLVTKVVALKLVISMINLGKTKDLESYYDNITLSPWTLLSMIPSSLLYYIWVLPLYLYFNNIMRDSLGIIIDNRINLALILLEKVEIYLKGYVDIVVRLGGNIKEIFHIQKINHLYSITRKPKLTISNTFLKVNTTNTTPLKKLGWFWGYEKYYYFPCFKVGDDWRFVANPDKVKIYLGIDNKNLNNHDISLGEVKLENVIVNKLIAKGLLKSIWCSNPLQNLEFRAEEVSKPILSSFDLNDLLQLNKDNDREEYILQFTAPPKSGYNPIVYMQSTNSNLSQSEFNMNESTSEPNLLQVYTGEFSLPLQNTYTHKDIYLKVLQNLEADVVDNDLTKIPSISKMDLDNSPNKSILDDLENDLYDISYYLNLIYEKHPSLVSDNTFNNILNDAKVILTNCISRQSDPRAILITKYLTEIYLVNVTLDFSLDKRSTIELEESLLALQNSLEYVKSWKPIGNLNLPNPREYIDNAGPELQSILRRSMWEFIKMDGIAVKASNTVPNTEVLIHDSSSNYPSNLVTVIDLYLGEAKAFNSRQSIIDKYNRYFREFSPTNFMRYDVIYKSRFILKEGLNDNLTTEVGKVVYITNGDIREYKKYEQVDAKDKKVTIIDLDKTRAITYLSVKKASAECSEFCGTTIKKYLNKDMRYRGRFIFKNGLIDNLTTKVNEFVNLTDDQLVVYKSYNWV